MTTFVEALADALRQAGDYNRLIELRPAAVLWPDEKREWEPIVPLLRAELPVLALGPYNPAAGTGPAPWLRCMIARSLPEPSLPGGTPIVYLPGHSARELRDLNPCPKELEALAELQYRGEIWARPDGQDWSPPSFFKDRDAGIGVGLREDAPTWQALCAALPRVAQLSLEELLENAPWKVRDFEMLLLPASTGHSISIETIIANGESHEVEFKSSAFFDIKGNGANNALVTNEVVEAIVGFMNAGGGMLLIGVADDGQPLGLDVDWRTMTEKERSRDRYQLRLRQKLTNETGQQFGSLVSFAFQHVGNEEVCLVRVDPAPGPVFWKTGNSEEFPVRQGNQTRKLKMSAAWEYCRSHWAPGGAT